MKGLIFTYVMTYGGALVSLADPFPGLLIYVCFAIIRPESLWYWSVPQGNYSRIVAVALLVGWLIQGFGRWRFGRARGVVTALIFFWVWSALSAAVSPDPALAFALVESLSKIVLPFLVGITTINSVARLKLLAWVIVLSHGYVAYDLNLSYLTGFNRIAEIGFGGMDNNSVAITLVACIGPAFFLGLHAERWWLKAAALGSALLMVHAVLLSFSRGGMLAMLLTAGVTFWLIPKRPVHFALFAVGLAVGLRLAGPEVMERFQSSFAEKSQRDASAESRLDLWADCLDAMAHAPILGVGPNQWGQVAPRYGWPIGKEAHSLWIQMGAELGLPGVISLMLFYGLCVVRLRPLARENSAVPDPWLRYLARAVIASIGGFALAAQFVTLAGLEAPYYITLIGAGVLKLASVPQAAGAAAPAPAPATAAPADGYAPPVPNGLPVLK
jgi:probable O-glycosylation ligase (exosortase A-associated)